MPDYTKLCEDLRGNRFDYIIDNFFNGGTATADGVKAADAIESLAAELARVMAERDAAVKCINDVQTYLELGSAKYIAHTIRCWRRDWSGPQEAGEVHHAD